MTFIDAELLTALRTAAVHLPVDDLADQVGIPLATVEERVGELRAAGFDIELRPGYGYRLVATPDRLIADDLRSRLGTGCGIREILVFEETGSTNDVASQAGRNGAAGGLAVFAERQTAGRGRFGRRWESASHKGLWFSLLVRPDLPMALWPRLTTWTAVVVSAALERHVAARVSIKWPNDCFIGGRKVAGILIEAGHDQHQAPFAVIGIGVNVNQDREDFPEELAVRATSLALAAGSPIDRSALAATLLTELDRRLPDLTGAFSKVIAEAEQRNFLLGRWIQVQTGGGLVEGVAECLDEQGQLLLRRQDGECALLNAGEVTLNVAGGTAIS